MARKKYPVELHKRAYELWASGHNLSEIQDILAVDRRTLRAWSKPSYPCACGYHGWLALRLAQFAGEEGKENGEALPESGEGELEVRLAPPRLAPAGREVADIPANVWERLSQRYGTRVSPELTGDVEADLVATAYLILARVRAVLAELTPHDAYQAVQLLRVAAQLLTEFKPILGVEEEREIQVVLPKFHREQLWTKEAEGEEEVEDEA